MNSATEIFVSETDFVGSYCDPPENMVPFFDRLAVHHPKRGLWLLMNLSETLYIR